MQNQYFELSNTKLQIIVLKPYILFSAKTIMHIIRWLKQTSK